jgi:hypothetical protein
VSGARISPNTAALLDRVKLEQRRRAADQPRRKQPVDPLAGYREPVSAPVRPLDAFIRKLNSEITP